MLGNCSFSGFLNIWQGIVTIKRMLWFSFIIFSTIINWR